MFSQHKGKIPTKILLLSVLFMLMRINGYSQCNPHYFELSKVWPPGTLCENGPVTVKAEYINYYNYGYVYGEFRWYASASATSPAHIWPIGHDFTFYSEHSFNTASQSSIWISFYDWLTGCETGRVSYIAPAVPPTPVITQEYATMCGDGIGRIQMRSNVSGTSFTLYKLEGGIYQNILPPNSTGYFELDDFYGENADKYYVNGSVGTGCIATGGYVQVLFDVPPQGGTTKSVNTNLSTNTIHSNTYGATRLEGHNGSVTGWVYSFTSSAGPFTSWGQAGLTTTSATCCIEGNEPGRTLWVRAKVKRGTCPDVLSAPTSYYWQPNPIVVNAGPDQATSGAAFFNGTATGGNGGIVSYQWTQRSGPPLGLTGATAPTLGLSASGRTADYVLRLTATDAYGRQGHDEVTLKVINFSLFKQHPSGPICAAQPVTLRAEYTLPEAGSTASVYGEFRWYSDRAASPSTPVHTWAVGESSPYSDYSFTPLAGVTRISVKFYDYTTATETTSQFYEMDVSVTPVITQEYATMCGDGIGRIQMRSNVSGTSFTLYKLEGGTYQNILPPNSTGYFELDDFYGENADKYYVNGSVGTGCIATGGYVQVLFDVPPQGGTTKSVNTNLSTNTIHSNTYGATKVEGHNGTVTEWMYSMTSSAGPFASWGQAGLTTTSETCCIAGNAPGQTIWISAKVKRGTCPDVLSAPTSYYWQPNPIVVNAGPDQATSGAAFFNGTATGGNGGIVSYQWTQRSGPPLGLTGATAPTLGLSASGRTADYVLRLTATDAYGRQGHDEVTLKVINFSLFKQHPSGPICAAQPVMLRAEYTLPEAGSTASVYGEFRWYSDRVASPSTPVHTWAVGESSPYSDYSFTPLDDITRISVKFYDYTTATETTSQFYDIDISPIPDIFQEYARMCADGIGKIQMRSTSSNASFELKKLIDAPTSEYEYIGSNSTGYFEFSDFYGEDADKYYVGVAAEAGCPGQNFLQINFDIQIDIGAPAITGVTSFCTEDGTTLNASGGDGIFRWYGSDETVIHEGDELEIPANLPAATYNYSVERISPQGCISLKALPSVRVYQPPVNPTISPIAPFCEFEIITLSGQPIGDIVDFQWFDSDGVPLGDGLEQDVEIASIGNYTYQYSAVNSIGCVSDVKSPVAVSVVSCSDENLNTIETIAYIPKSTSEGEYEIVTHSKSYFNDTGRLIQAQTKSLQENEILGTQPIHDELNRGAINSLAAPLDISDFKYKYLFVTDINGNLYDHSEFDHPVGAQPGTLGWYYSESNERETYVPTTEYPYSRTDFYDDGTGEVRFSASPGDQHRLGAGHEVLSGTFPVFSELSDYLTKRVTVIPGITQDGSLTNEGVQSIVRDENGKYAVSMSDKSGKAVMSARSGTQEDHVLAISNTIISHGDPDPLRPDAPNHRPMTYFYILHSQPVSISGSTDFIIENIITNERKAEGETFADEDGMWPAGFYRVLLPNETSEIELSYVNYFLDVSLQFYDDAGRLVSSISPNGYEAWTEGTDYQYIDKTTYRYNHQGWLLSLTEPDAGTTNYVYRKDGKIRFSQNAEQKENNRFAYTHYDKLGRPVESGEYTGTDLAFVAMTDAAFASSSMRLELEKSYDQISWSNAVKKDWVKTHFDLPVELNTNLPETVSQDFVRGAVSCTENIYNKTWYSYDELGRVTWMAQKPTALPRAFVTKYSYDFLGNVLSVENTSYTGGEPVNSFFHHYEYDADQRLTKVHTSPDGSTKTLRATYDYYLHGPLKRIELGEKIQGIDFVYNINGWLTHINHPDGGQADPGKDGEAGNHSDFKADVFGMVLDYYESDLGSLFNTGSLNPHKKMHHLPFGNEETVAMHQPLMRFIDHSDNTGSFKDFSAVNPRYKRMIDQLKERSQK